MFVGLEAENTPSLPLSQTLPFPTVCSIFSFKFVWCFRRGAIFFYTKEKLCISWPSRSTVWPHKQIKNSPNKSLWRQRSPAAPYRSPPDLRDLPDIYIFKKTHCCIKSNMCSSSSQCGCVGTAGVRAQRSRPGETLQPESQENMVDFVSEAKETAVRLMSEWLKSLKMSLIMSSICM